VDLPRFAFVCVRDEPRYFVPGHRLPAPAIVLRRRSRSAGNRSWLDRWLV